MPLRVAIVGAAGKMGQAMGHALVSDPEFSVVSAVDICSVGHEAFGSGSATIVSTVREALDHGPVDVLLDFSDAAHAPLSAETALPLGINVVIGCTGLAISDVDRVERAATESGVAAMIVPNFAIGAVLAMHFAEFAAKWMPSVEIIELHHDKKLDAPSGTAKLTASKISKARMPNAVLAATSEQASRGAVINGVVVHSVRLPGLVAHQEVIFGGTGETLTIRHDSMDRASFSEGVKLALRRVRSLSGLTVGLESLLFEPHE